MTPVRLSLRLAIASGICFVFARAQTAPSVPAPKSSMNDEVVTLSEFSVSATTENAYSANDTTSGSRTNTAVKDLPYAVNSLTSDFFKDFSVFDLTEELSYMSSVTGVDDSMAFTSRGFFNAANNNLYNGHQRLGLIDVGTIDRVEVIKGPSGSIYGQSNPGGVMSIMTRRPTTTPHQSISASYGSYDTSQDQFHLSGPIPLGRTPKLFYNIDGSYLHRHYDEPAQTRFTKSLAGTLVFKPTDATNFTLQSNFASFKNPAEFNLPYLIHTGPNPYAGVGTVSKTATMTIFDGYAWQLYKQHYASPQDFKWRQTFGVTASLEHRFNSWLSFRGSYDYYHNPIETYDTLRNSLNFDPNVGTFARAGATPTWSTIYGSGHSYSGDLLAHYKFRGTDQQTLLTVDDYLNNRRDYANASIAGTFTPITGGINPFAPITSEFIPRDPAHFTTTTTRDNAVEARGFGLTQQANLFSDRLLVYAGYRHDHTAGYQRIPTAAVTAVSYAGAPAGSGRETKIHDSNDASKFGFSYKITPQVSWYASRIESFIPFGTSVPLTVSLPAGTTAATVDPRILKTLSPAPETGVGYESGLKSDFLDHTVSLSADVYSIKRQNVAVTELANPNDPTSTTVTVNEGDQTSKGFELDGNFRLSSKLMALVSYSYTDTRLSNQGVNVYANGKRARAVPYDSLSGALRYKILPRLGLLLSMRYQGNTLAESPTTGLVKNPLTGLFDASDGRARLKTPAYAVWNLGAAYRWKSAWEHLDESVNFAVKNVLDRRYFSPGNNHYVADGRGFYVTYSVAH